MAIITNFNILKSLHTEAMSRGTGSKQWIEFASVMADSFPALYETAKQMNERLATVKEARDVNLMTDSELLILWEEASHIAEKGERRVAYGRAVEAAVLETHGLVVAQPAGG